MHGCATRSGDQRSAALPVVLESAVEQQHRKARMALAPRTVQNMPDCLQREPMTVLQPASMTPEPTNKCWRGIRDSACARCFCRK